MLNYSHLLKIKFGYTAYFTKRHIFVFFNNTRLYSSTADQGHALVTDKSILTLILLTWRIWWAPNNVSRWQMGFNSSFKGL